MAKKKVKKTEDPHDVGYGLGETIIQDLEQRSEWSLEQFYEALDAAISALTDRNALQQSELKRL